jgi:hypothetical protein
MAKKNQLNVSIGVDSKGYEKSWDEIIKITQESGNDLEKEAAKMALAVSKKIEKMSPKSQARQLETLTVKMVEMGMEGTKAFNMVTKSAGALKATIDDAKGMIDAMRPDAPFNALNTTLGASAQAFAGVQGAMALFGAESEDLQKTLLKVQGAMALAEGFKAIDGLTDGFQQLNMVIKQNPLIAGAAIFAAATAAIIAMSDSTDELTVKTKAYNDIRQKAFDSTVEERVGLEQLLRKYNDKNTTDKQRLDIQRQLVEQYPKFLGQISTERVETDKVNNAVKGLIGTYKKQAEAQAAKELYIEALKKEKKLTKEFAEDQMRLMGMGANPVVKMFLEKTGMATGLEELTSVKLEVQELAKAYDTLANEADNANKAQTKTFGSDLTDSIDRSTKKVKEYTAALPKAPKSKVDMTPLSAGEDLGNPFERKASTPQTNFSPIEGGMYEPSAPSQPAGTTINPAQLIDPEKLAESKKAMLEMEALSQQISSSIVSAFSAIGDEMAASLDTGNKAMDRFAGAMIKTVTEIIGMLVAQAVGNAIVGGTQAGTATGPAAPFTTPAFIATAVGGVMAAFAAIPKFETGGVVGGSSYHGDKILARVNSGELILNTGQQRAVLNAMGNSNMVMAETKISGRDLAIVLKKYNQDISRG